MKKNKPIHFIHLKHEYRCVAACNIWMVNTSPIEHLPTSRLFPNDAWGTFNVKRVTCKNCLKTKEYKEALDRDKYPLFHWREYI